MRRAFSLDFLLAEHRHSPAAPSPAPRSERRLGVSGRCVVGRDRPSKSPELAEALAKLEPQAAGPLAADFRDVSRQAGAALAAR